MFCPKCGKEIPDQATFCPKCGVAVSGRRTAAAPGSSAPPVEQAPAAQGQSATATAVKPKKKGRGKVLLVAAVLLIAAIFLLPKLAGSPEGPAEDPPAEDITPQDEMEEEVLSPEAELLAIIDEVEAVHQKAMDDFPEASEEDDYADYVETTRRQVQIMNDFLADLEGLREKANAVNVQDPKLRGVQDEYFSMLRDSRKAWVAILTFSADYIEFFDENVAERPVEVDYNSLTAYSEDLNEWFQKTMTGYDAISCPACIADEWARYGEILRYNEDIAKKTVLAIQCNDWLRLYSARNIESRYNTAEEEQFSKLFDCMDGEGDHANNQRWIASNLAEETHAYCEMTPEERDAYEFKNIRTGKILLNYDVVDTIYPSLYNTYDAFAIIKTGCISGTRAIVVEVEIDGFTQQYRESFNLDSSYKAIYIKPPALTSELNLSSAKPAQLKITISEKDGTLIEAKSFPVTLMSKYDFNWYSDEYGVSTRDNILCFLTPESTKIDKLKLQAAVEVKNIAGGAGSESFAGYQPMGNWNQYVNTYLHAAGLMSAINKMGIRYVNDAFSISDQMGQHIKLPDDVLENQSGLCIETALVVASALQSAGMHAFLVFPQGHAMVAVEVWNSGDHAGEYFLIETTAIESSTTALFNADAVQLSKGDFPSYWNQSDRYSLHAPIEYLDRNTWADYVQNYFEYIIDCDDSRLLGMTPFAN